FFRDRRVQKEINQISVICVHSKLRCHWNGNIGELLEHLKSCPYEKKVMCPHCKDVFLLSEYQSHVSQCPPIQCEPSNNRPIQRSNSFNHSLPEEHMYYTAIAFESEMRQSQLCSGPGQGGSVEDVTDLSPTLSPISSLTANISSLIQISVAVSDGHNST
uniref:TRAF-type domain-containing protein n=1 Tax=Amphimedon queenslandica TaxID=400682 RepID=A0A1X7UQQ8_AMPQE